MNFFKRKNLTLLVAGLCFWYSNLQAQQIQGQIALTLNFGTHVENIGINSNVAFTAAFTQLNLGSQMKFNFLTYGKRKFVPEYRLALGMLILGGKKTLVEDFHFDALNHNTKYQNAIGFNYLWYFDESETSQRSGAWSVHQNYFSILFENDVFGGQAKDRFRSGILQFNYRYQDLKFFTQVYIWTGETAHSTWIKEAKPGCPNGYRSLENLPYGKTSHGIWSVGVHAKVSNKQLVTFKTGIDSEQIRHLFQNRISHDLIFLPKSYPRNTPHYPRLNAEGLPVFNKKERRKDRFYFQASLNEVWSN